VKNKKEKKIWKLKKNYLGNEFNDDNHLPIFPKRALVTLDFQTFSFYIQFSLDTGNARPSTIVQVPLRVPPIKIKVPRPEKPMKTSVSIPPLDTKFHCLLKLDRLNLSLYDISNLPIASQIKNKKPNESPSSSDSTNIKTKPFTITKQHEHHKQLKRLNSSLAKKQPSPPSDISKEKHNKELSSIRLSSSSSDLALSLNKDKMSTSASPSPIYQPKSSIQKQSSLVTDIKKKVKRPCLPPEYRCSLSLSPIDLSTYDLDLSALNLPMDIETTVTGELISV
jgi:hypothetical protein